MQPDGFMDSQSSCSVRVSSLSPGYIGYWGRRDVPERAGQGLQACSDSLLVPVRYNNQWMIVDYKAFIPDGPSPGSRVLTILEQIP